MKKNATPWICSAVLVLMGMNVPGFAETAQETVETTVVAVPRAGVLSVSDNDETQRVRVFGIDAPEAGQPYADEAQAQARDWLLGKRVKMRQVTRDNTGLPVVHITLPDGRDFAEEMTRAGLAWWDRENAPKARNLRLLNAEAIMEEKGLWSQDSPLAPWDYRASHEDLEGYTYATEERTRTAVAAPLTEAEGDPGVEDEVRSVSASGDAVKDPIRFDPREVEQEVRNLDYGSLMMQHRPRVATGEDGQPMGITADNIGQIPLAPMLGLRDGDVITEVNGVPVTNMNQIPQLVNQFRDVKQFNVTVMRNGNPVSIPIQIP